MSLKENILLLKKEGLTYDEICEKLNCAKSTVSYHCSGLNNTVNKVSDDEKEKIKIYYKTHTILETVEKFGFSKSTIVRICGKKTVKLTEDEVRQNNSKAVQKRRLKLKQLSVDYKGGCCERCGYKKSLSALEFHHLDPNEKDFSISKNGDTKSWERIKKELDKCILVCANCHREIHDELRGMVNS